MKNPITTLKAINDFFDNTPQCIVDNMLKKVKAMSIDDIYIDDYFNSFENQFKIVTVSEYFSVNGFTDGKMVIEDVNISDTIIVKSLSLGSNTYETNISKPDCTFAA